MSRLPVVLKLDGHSGLLVNARSSGEASPTFHSAAASSGFSGQELPPRSLSVSPDEDNRP
jgi:hypothetical protein